MSQDTASKSKEKKQQRDAERKKGGKKRKHQEIEEQDTRPPQDELKKDFIPLDRRTEDGTQEQDVDSASAEAKPKSKKRKGKEAEEAIQEDSNIAPVAQEPKSKRRRKVKHNTTNDSAETADGAEAAKPHKSRFILFIGNLPYSATNATIQAHFKKLEPFTLRHSTDPKTKKSKGFAFLEFENYDRMKTCLKLYHHSMFDPVAQATDGAENQGDEGAKAVGSKRSKAKEARRINVELTAGGGGKTEARKEKIKKKNVRLEEQRQRRAEVERKEKGKSHRGEGGEDGAKPSREKKTEAEPVADDAGDIHPSRLARMQA